VIVSFSLLASAETGSLCLTRFASLANLHISVSSSSAPASTAIPIPGPSRNRNRGPGEREQRQLAGRERAGDQDRGTCHSMYLFLCHPSIASPALLLLLSAHAFSFFHVFLLSFIWRPSHVHLPSTIHDTLLLSLPPCFPRACGGASPHPTPSSHPSTAYVLFVASDDLRHDHDRFRPPPKTTRRSSIERPS
jgi:hypothetical protein